jgi:hypothetical protein
MPSEHNRLDNRTRSEIADAVWQVFGLIAARVGLTFDTEGITIRVNFNEEMDLDGPTFISGVVKGFMEYEEVSMHLK